MKGSEKPEEVDFALLSNVNRHSTVVDHIKTFNHARDKLMSEKASEWVKKKTFRGFFCYSSDSFLLPNTNKEEEMKYL